MVVQKCINLAQILFKSICHFSRRSHNSYNRYSYPFCQAFSYSLYTFPSLFNIIRYFIYLAGLLLHILYSLTKRRRKLVKQSQSRIYKFTHYSSLSFFMSSISCLINAVIICRSYSPISQKMRGEILCRRKSQYIVLTSPSA